MKQEEREKLLSCIVGSGQVTIGNMMIGDKNTLNYYEREKEESAVYSDQQIARAIMEISGKGKPLSLMRHYVGVICVLQTLGWSHKFAACCNRINNLPGYESFPVRCESGALKSTQIMKFVGTDYREWRNYEPHSSEERRLFNECKFAADAFAEALKSLM
mgnify:CR=1 FL=1